MHRRKVIEATYNEGEVNFLRSSGRKSRWWELKLECGHEVFRRVTRKQIIDDSEPKFIYCEDCE